MPRFNIPHMTCGHCKETVENAISDLDGSSKVVVDLDTHNIDVDTQADSGAVVAALKVAGYDAELIKA